MADIYAKFSCMNCQEEIAGIRVKCSVCQNYELCLSCFSCGAESGQHKNDHSYRFMDSGTIKVFSGKGVWSAKEEMRLLDAVEQYGFGNWEDISKHIETRSPDEAKDEYVQRFLDGNIGKLTWPRAASSRSVLKDYTVTDSGALSPNSTSRLPPLDATAEEATFIGYMPHRDDFDREFDNEAETLVSPLFVNLAEDEDIEIAMKLCHVDMYTRRLRERTRRKRLCRDYQLVSNFFSMTRKDRPIRKRISRYERELREKFRVYAQFYTSQEFDSIIRNLIRQHELSLRIRELERYRRGGVTKFEECTHFEQQREHREHIRDKIAGSSGPILSAPSMETKNEESERRGSYYSNAKRSTPSFLSVSSIQGSNAVGDKVAGGVVVGEGVVLRAVPFLPELRLISAKERTMCSSLSLSPYELMSAKVQALTDIMVQTPAGGYQRPLEKLHACPVKRYLVANGIVKAKYRRT